MNEYKIKYNYCTGYYERFGNYGNSFNGTKILEAETANKALEIMRAELRGREEIKRFFIDDIEKM